MTQRDLRIDLTINGSMVKRERDNSLLDLSQIFQDKFFWNHLETIYCDIRKNCKFACFTEALHATRARFCSWKSFSFWLKGVDDKILKTRKTNLQSDLWSWPRHCRPPHRALRRPRQLLPDYYRERLIQTFLECKGS